MLLFLQLTDCFWHKTTHKLHFCMLEVPLAHCVRGGMVRTDGQRRGKRCTIPPATIGAGGISNSQEHASPFDLFHDHLPILHRKLHLIPVERETIHAGFVVVVGGTRVLGKDFA